MGSPKAQASASRATREGPSLNHLPVYSPVIPSLYSQCAGVWPNWVGAVSLFPPSVRDLRTFHSNRLPLKTARHDAFLDARDLALEAVVVEQLQTTRGELHDVSERINTAKGILSRVRVTAPVRGGGVKLRYHTPGGVVETGKSIMELLPLNDDLVIETRVRPQDIDHVKRGQHATVRLTALNRR
jgi:hypothetical protein